MSPAQRSARRASLFLLIVFGLIYSSCAEVTTLRCRRPQGECLLTQERLLPRSHEVTIRLADLQGAHTDDGSSPGRGKTRGRTILETRQGPVPVEVWTGGDMPDVSSQVNDFVKRKDQQELLVRHDTRLGTLGSACFLLIGSLLLFGMSFVKSLSTTRGR